MQLRSDHHVVLARAGLGEDLAGDVFMLDGLFGLPGEVVLAVEARGGVGAGPWRVRSECVMAAV